MGPEADLGAEGQLDPNSLPSAQTRLPAQINAVVLSRVGQKWIHVSAWPVVHPPSAWGAFPSYLGSLPATRSQGRGWMNHRPSQDGIDPGRPGSSHQHVQSFSVADLPYGNVSTHLRCGKNKTDNLNLDKFQSRAFKPPSPALSQGFGLNMPLS